MWANCNSPLQHTQTNPYHAHDVFLCIYMYIYIYICQRLDNTRVGANCNSPFHMGAIENMGELNYGRIWGKNARNSIGRFANRPYNARKKPHANINVQWSMINVHWPLFTDLCSLPLLTVHCSLFTVHCSLTSHFYSHFSQRFFLTCTSKMLYFCIEFKTGLRR